MAVQGNVLDPPENQRSVTFGDGEVDDLVERPCTVTKVRVRGIGG